MLTMLTLSLANSSCLTTTISASSSTLVTEPRRALAALTIGPRSSSWAYPVGSLAATSHNRSIEEPEDKLNIKLNKSWKIYDEILKNITFQMQFSLRAISTAENLDSSDHKIIFFMVTSTTVKQVDSFFAPVFNFSSSQMQISG